jgi:LacI family transcriptional regulator
MRVTVKDVARQANVSPGTVSNVLTGKRPVSQATRQRILLAIEELGYQPDLLARSLVNRRSDTLAVVASGLEYYGPSRTLVGIEQQAEELGYSLLLSLLHRPTECTVGPALEALAARRVDGIIWAVPEIGHNHAWIPYDRLNKLPPIIFLTMEPRPGLAVVTVDNRGGACQVTRHLLEGGRRTIGLIGGPQLWWEARERLAGWQQGLQEAGLEAAPSLQVEGNWSAASGEQGLYRLLDRRPDVDAVLACNDPMALGALRAAQLLGRRIPQDLAVVGFDNIPESAFFWPPLTTVRQRLVELGRIAVQELHKIIEAKQQPDLNLEPPVIMLTPELVLRDSSLATA